MAKSIISFKFRAAKEYFLKFEENPYSNLIGEIVNEFIKKLGWVSEPLLTMHGLINCQFQI